MRSVLMNNGTGGGVGTGTGADTERTQDRNGNGSGSGSGDENEESDGGGKGHENGKNEREEGGYDIRHVKKQVEYKTKHYHNARSIISVDMRPRLQAAKSLVRETWHRGEPRAIRTEGAGTVTITRTGMGTKTETRIERKVEGRESVGTYEVVTEVIEVGRKTRERGRRQQAQSQDPTPQRERRTIQRTRDQGWEARERIWEGGGEVKKRKNLRRVMDACGKRGRLGRKNKKNVDKAVLVHYIPTKKIQTIESKHKRKRNALRT